MSAFAITVITPPEFVHSAAFNEIAETLHHGLLSLGHDSIRTTKSNIVNRQHIILGSNLLPHHPMPLADNAILYNLEQIQEGSYWLTPELLKYFRHYTLWDYSSTNAKKLHSIDVQVDRVLPIGYTPSLTRIDPTITRDIDVLFIGSINERRQTTLDQMRVLGLNVVVGYGVYDTQRDALIARAKVVLNHHFYETKVLEMVRISYLLANRAVVLSESSANPEEDQLFADGVAFAAYDELPQMALRLVQDSDLRMQLSQKGFAMIRQRPIETYLQTVLA